MSDLGCIHRSVAAERPDSPTVLLLHGTGGDENDLIPLAQDVAPGAALLTVRGKVLENGMPRFFRRFAEGVFDIEDLKVRTDELARFVEGARREYAIAGPLFALGYSNGANIASTLMLTRPGVLAGGVLLRAMPTMQIEEKPDLAGVPVLLAAGRRDPIVRVEQSLALQEMFEACGAELSLHWHEGGHELGADDVAVASRWLGVAMNSRS
ncbi:MAG TPA: alpha/beta hydrolase [Bryobacteraceae bacterium]|nr:alpha/beta hydrolase [Bryobacteraceae bacterium]